MIQIMVVVMMLVLNEGKWEWVVIGTGDSDLYGVAVPPVAMDIKEKKEEEKKNK